MGRGQVRPDRYRGGVRNLVLVPAVGTASFVETLERIWDAGHAALPLDPRLPQAAADALVGRLAPTHVADGDRWEALPDGRPVEDGDALVVATSGSTGQPKGVVLTHASLHASAVATSARLDVDPTTDRWLACLPLAHVGGLGVVVRALVTGTPVELARRPDPEMIASAPERGVTLTALVATVLGRADTSGFRVVLVGGAAAPSDVGDNVVVTWGMTETGGGIVYDGTPLEGTEVRSTDGRLEVRSPSLLRCYRDRSGDIDPRAQDGWFDTGDLGELNAGRVVVHGRAGDLIITGGENVWPAPVEQVLATCPGVAEVAVVGRPDPEWGQVVTAVVVAADATSPPTLDQLRSHVRAELPAHAAPRRVEFVEAIARTPLGKVQRASL